MGKKVQEWSPFQLGLSGKDLKATANTAYESPILDLSQFILFTASLKVTVTGAATLGVCKLTMQLYAKDGIVAIGAPFDILTAIGTAANRDEYVSWGIGAGGKVGHGTLGSNFDALRNLMRAKFILTVTTAANAATSCVGSLRLMASD